ncbi:MAG: hypothetical protein P1U74_08810 [Legionellaceae bacterium]|nr:hypothetical protein [Legionellaceae bacterium]
MTKRKVDKLETSVDFSNSGDELWNQALNQQIYAVRAKTKVISLKYFKLAKDLSMQAREAYIEAFKLAELEQTSKNVIEQYEDYAKKTLDELILPFEISIGKIEQEINTAKERHESRQKSSPRAQFTPKLKPTISPANAFQSTSVFFKSEEVTELQGLYSLKDYENLDAFAHIPGNSMDKINLIKERLLKVQYKCARETDMPDRDDKIRKAHQILELSYDFSDKLLPWSRDFATKSESLSIIEAANRSITAALSIFSLNDDQSGRRMCKERRRELAEAENLVNSFGLDLSASS